MKAKIEGFKQEPYKFLSNMTLFPRPVKINGISYNSSESYYQAMKFTDNNIKKRIGMLNPYSAKKAGREGVVRTDWDKIKQRVMIQILRYKFKRIPEFREKLLVTRNSYIEETNWWGDTYWGVCRGSGKNILGVMLMTVRDEIVNGDNTVSSNWKDII